MTKKKIGIMLDSSCDIDENEARELDVHVLRMPIVIDGYEYMDSIDISSEEVSRLLGEGKLAKTSQATLGSLLEMYDRLLEEYEELIYIPLSSGLSGMYNTAFQYAKDEKYKGHIHVIDAKLACYPVITVVKDVKKMLDKGVSIEKIKAKLEDHSYLLAIIIPHDINYLKMGGRISPAAASLANLLKIVPILTVKDGMIDVYDKVRTEKKAIKVGLEPIIAVDDKDKYRYMVIHDNRLEDALALKAEMEAVLKTEVEIQKFGPVILSHAGPKTIAFGRIEKLVND